MGRTYLLCEIQLFLDSEVYNYTNCLVVWQFLMNKIDTKEIASTVFKTLELLKKLQLQPQCCQPLISWGHVALGPSMFHPAFVKLHFSVTYSSHLSGNYPYMLKKRNLTRQVFFLAGIKVAKSNKKKENISSLFCLFPLKIKHTTTLEYRKELKFFLFMQGQSNISAELLIRHLNAWENLAAVAACCDTVRICLCFLPSPLTVGSAPRCAASFSPSPPLRLIPRRLST